MKQKCSIRFNKIWIIESLRNDSKTGRNLRENISDYLDYEDTKYKDRDVSVVYKTPNTKREFLNVLNEILCEAENVYPIIHLECHGRGRGLETADGKFVAWHELSDIFRKINRACRLNLLIVVAACKGLYLINTFKQLAGGTPYCAVIGAETDLKAGDIEKDFSAFYAEFFKELDLDSAMRQINKKTPKYRFISAEYLFLKMYKKYHKEMFSGKSRQKNVERLVTLVLNDVTLMTMLISKYKDAEDNPVKFVRGSIKKIFNENTESFFNLIKERYFFIDCFPENEERFSFSYQDVISNPNLL